MGWWVGLAGNESPQQEVECGSRTFNFSLSQTLRDNITWPAAPLLTGKRIHDHVAPIMAPLLSVCFRVSFKILLFVSKKRADALLSSRTFALSYPS